jgi:SagB-type dehydrogenase family enzyme
MTQYRTFELYHENSKLTNGDIDLYTWINYVNTDLSVRSVISKPILEYGGLNEIDLPETIKKNPIALQETLAKRRSERDFSGAPCAVETFSTLLRDALKENIEVVHEDGVKWNFRPYPSGGGLYPIDIYVAIFNVEGIAKGVYLYNPKKHTISELDNNNDLSLIENGLPTLKKELDTTAFLIFLVSDLEKMAFKYQERAYRFALLECGHISQNLLLCATALNIKSFPVGAYLDNEINLFLDLDGVTSNVQYIMVFGM